MPKSRIRKNRQSATQQRDAATRRVEAMITRLTAVKAVAPEYQNADFAKELGKYAGLLLKFSGTAELRDRLEKLAAEVS